MDKEQLISELQKEHSYFLDLWKNAGVASGGDLMNKIKDIERKIKELQKMQTDSGTIPIQEVPNEAENVIDFVQKGQILEALDFMLRDKSQKDNFNTCILLKSQISDIEKQRSLNLLSFDEYKREKARIINAILQINK